MNSEALNRRYIATPDDVVHEAVEGEVVIVNLRNGKYFSLEAAGVDCWLLLITALPVAEVIDRLASCYAASADLIRDSLLALIEQLLAEELLMPAEEAGQDPGSVAALPVLQGGSFAPPQLNIYTDMEELLLVDPVHQSADVS